MSTCTACGRDLAERTVECVGRGVRYCPGHRARRDRGRPTRAPGNGRDPIRTRAAAPAGGATSTGEPPSTGNSGESGDPATATSPASGRPGDGRSDDGPGSGTFEETQRPHRAVRWVIAGVLAVTLGYPVYMLLATPVPVAPWALLMATLVVAVGFPLGGVLWWLAGTAIHTRVDDEGVDVTWERSPPMTPDGVRVPFEEVTGVSRWRSRRGMVARTGDGVAGTLRRTRESGANPDWYALSVSGPGVRIQRRDAPDVWVGSARHGELATAIAEGAGLA